MAGFRSEPDGLRTAARLSLNGVNSENLVPAKDDLARTEQEDPDAFKGGAALGQVLTEWTEARRLLAEVLNDNIDNVELAKQALVEIADRYDAEDAAIATRLNEIGGLS